MVVLVDSFAERQRIGIFAIPGRSFSLYGTGLYKEMNYSAGDSLDVENCT